MLCGAGRVGEGSDIACRTEGVNGESAVDRMVDIER